MLQLIPKFADFFLDLLAYLFVTWILKSPVGLKWNSNREVHSSTRSTEANRDKSRSVAFCGVLNLKFNVIRLAQVILKLRVVYGQNIIDVPDYNHPDVSV